MAQDIPIAFQQDVPTRFFNAVQEMLSPAANFQLVQVGANVLQIQAGPGDRQASISINGQYRWVSNTIGVTVSGAAGVYDIHAVNSAPTAATPSTDSSPQGFSLASVPLGGAVSGAYASRRIAHVGFNGNTITWIEQLAGQPSTAALISMILPPGIFMPYAGGVVPVGWLACDGSVVGISAYPGLFAAIGTTFTGDYTATHGSPPPGGTFALPDMRGRAAFGPDAMGAAGASGRLAGLGPGSGGGERVHTLSAGEIPPVPVVALQDGATSPFPLDGSGRVPVASTYAGGGTALQVTTVGGFYWGLETGGGGGSHNNLPPYLTAGSYIIKT